MRVILHRASVWNPTVQSVCRPNRFLYGVDDGPVCQNRPVLLVTEIVCREVDRQPVRGAPELQREGER